MDDGALGGLPVRVRGDGIVLRGYVADDEPSLRAAFSDPVTQLWNPPGVDPDVTAWWQHRADWSNGQHATWAVTDAGDGRLVGDVSLHELDLVHGDGEIGYTVLPAERGRGVARRAIDSAARYAFDRIGLFRIELYHAVENVASCNAALGAGFEVEGTLRQSHRYGDGERHDEHLHARLATD